jgi:uncharacterized protein YndB with AHSA1/START domain
MADPRVSVVVPVPVEEAFRVYTDQAADWLPAEHRFLRDSKSVVMEKGVGGRFYEKSADGAEVVRGTIVEWAAPERLAMTWRIGPGWRPVADDEHACVVVVEFRAAEAGETEVSLTYTHLERLGDFAPMLRAAIGSGDTLERYRVVAGRGGGRGL